MKELSVEIQFVTKLYLSNVPDNELRVSSFKGLLRYWWRATHFYDCEDVEELHDREGRLFGSTSQGQAKVIIYKPSPTIVHVSNTTLSMPGLQYLGYGLENASPIEEFEETLNIILPNDYLDEIINSLRAIAFFGNMGSRSRKGFGSMSIKSVTDIDRNELFSIQSSDDLQEQITKFLAKFTSNVLPDIPAFSNLINCYIHENNEFEKPMKYLNFIGEQLLLYRSFGRNGKVSISEGEEVVKENAHKNFKNDHDLIKNLSNGTTDHPERVVFGLPHNYYFSSSNKGKNIAVKPSNPNFRRASPLFIKIHQFNNKLIMVALVLKSKFLPNGEEISMVDQNKGVAVDVIVDEDFTVIDDFFTGNRGRTYFNDIKEIKGENINE